jgi:16S rRNA processing protein RimM
LADAPPEGLLEVGRIDRPHGLRGEVIVTLRTTATERLDRGARLWADSRWLVVQSAAPHQKRWRVRLEGVDDREAAEQVSGSLVFAAPLVEEGTRWLHDLIGAVAVLPDGTEVGVVEAIQDNPASDLLVLDSGALVPLVFAGDLVDGRIIIDPPPGLLELADG